MTVEKTALPIISQAARLVALAAIVFSAVYFVSDAIEAVQGGFSVGQLWLTLIAEVAIPGFVIGLAVVQRPELERLGWFGAMAYAYSYVFFTYTVVYALVEGTRDFGALSDDLRPWMFLNGAVMVVAGLCFGVGVIRAGVLPRWTAVALIAGVVLVALSGSLPEGPQLVAAGIRDLGFAGMGAALLVGRRRRLTVTAGDLTDPIRSIEAMHQPQADGAAPVEVAGPGVRGRASSTSGWVRGAAQDTAS